MIFTPTKNSPGDADSVNYRLLVQGGFVRQLMAGVYIYLPLGLRVLNKVRNIIRKEMNALGGQELLMPALHPAENWKKSGGWESIDVLFKLKSRTEKEFALGQSHEEVVTPLMQEFIHSYKDLPKAVYQIHWKYRDELRAKSGILRGREFEMKDMYSFHESQEDFDQFYNKVKEAYIRAYKKLGLVAKVTEASGGTFSEKISYEFMVLTDAGEDEILYCPDCEFCVNAADTQLKEGDNCKKCNGPGLKKATASEVGNVFDLGQKYSKDFGITYIDQEGNQKYPIMGCYGWGTTRTMGVVVEKFNDERGIVWPKSIAPYKVHLITLDDKIEESQDLYQKLVDAKVEVIWDDRKDISAGEKFGDADLIGCPYRVVVSNKSLASGALPAGRQGVELKERSKDDTKIVPPAELNSAIELLDK